MQQTPSMREVLEALEWVRGQMMYTGSPDFIRQREAEARVQDLCARLLRGDGEHGPAGGSDRGHERIVIGDRVRENRCAPLKGVHRFCFVMLSQRLRA